CPGGCRNPPGGADPGPVALVSTAKGGTVSDDDPGPDLPTAVRRLLDATNAEDSAAFLDAFAPDAVLDDWGRRFVGHEQIAGWNARENIGVHSRIAVTGARPTHAGLELAVQVSGGGYNGGGTFTVQTAGDTIQSLVIRG